jgi:hypothetical protein
VANPFFIRPMTEHQRTSGERRRVCLHSGAPASDCWQGGEMDLMARKYRFSRHARITYGTLSQEITARTASSTPNRVITARNFG